MIVATFDYWRVNHVGWLSPRAFSRHLLHVRSHGGDVRRKWLVNGVHQENSRNGEAIYSGEALQL